MKQNKRQLAIVAPIADTILQEHTCTHCGKCLSTARSLACHIGHCKLRHIKEAQEVHQAAAAAAAAEIDKEEAAAIQDRMSFKSLPPVKEDDHDVNMLRMLTRWRVKNTMKDVHIQQIKDDIPEILKLVQKRVQEAMKLDPHANLESVFATAQKALLQNLQSARAERGRAASYYEPAPVHVRVLGSSTIERATQYGMKHEVVEDVIVECQVEEQIEKLVCTPELAAEVLKDRRSKDDDIIADFQDGQVLLRLLLHACMVVCVCVCVCVCV
jgi:hypothetical protein